MIPLRRRVLLKLMAVADLGVIVIASMVALSTTTEFRAPLSVGHFLSLQIRLVDVAVLLLLFWGWNTIFRFFDMYGSKRLSRRRDQAIEILVAVLVGSAASFLALVAMGYTIPVVTVAAFAATAVVLLMVMRFALRITLERVRMRGRNLRYVLIVGTNPRALDIARGLDTNAALGYRVIGFADDPWPGASARHSLKLNVVTDLQNLDEYLRVEVVDEVIVCLPVKSHYDVLQKIVTACEEQGIILRFQPNIFQLKIGDWCQDHLEQDVLIGVHTGRMRGWRMAIKRAFDFVVSLMLIFIFSPILIVTAFAIKATSDGPAVFKQERMGIGKRRFEVFKFRTMVANAQALQKSLEDKNEMSGAAFKIAEDPRITPLGRFLRKTSIDELPQLFNVLKGDMSLVGPRPLPVRDFEGFNEDWHRRRFSVRPGITCLWQIMGRNQITFDHWMKLDMQYIDEWSLWLDLKILAWTLPAVLRGTGAA